VARHGGSGALEQLAAIERPLAAGAGLDAPSLCLRLVEAAWKASGLSGPAAVVCFASLAYAPARVDGTGERAVRFRQAVERQVQAVSRLAGTPITVRPFFPGISDISFFSGHMSAGEIEVLSANSPAWESRTGFDYRRLAGLDLPAANIGPWGRDYHQRTERIHAPYSFQVLPELLWQIAGDLLEISPQRHKER